MVACCRCLVLVNDAGEYRGSLMMVDGARELCW